MKRTLATSTSLALFFGLTGQALADSPTPRDVVTDHETSVGESAVDATVAETVETVSVAPVSGLTFSAEIIDQAGIGDIRDLGRITPGLNIVSETQFANTRIEMRGVGAPGNPSLDPSVALLVDGVHVPRVSAYLGALTDVKTVEVTRGPDGVLQGRNALMGAVSIATNEPVDTFEAHASILGGDFQRVGYEAMVNMPVSDTLAVRAAMTGNSRGGFGTNLLDGQELSFGDQFSGRLSAAMDVSENLRWVIRADHSHTTGDGIPVSTVVAGSFAPLYATRLRSVLDPDGDAPGVGPLPILNNTYAQYVSQVSKSNMDDRATGLSSLLTLDLPGGWNFIAASGWREWNNDQFQLSSDALPTAMQTRRGRFKSESWSHDLRVEAPDDLLDGRASVVVGLFGFQEDIFNGDYRGVNREFCDHYIRNTSDRSNRFSKVAACNQDTLLPFTSYSRFWQNAKTWSAYAQGNYDLAPGWDINLGIRHSWDQKSGFFDQASVATPLINVTSGQPLPSIDPAVTEASRYKLDKNRTTYRIGTTWQAAEDILVHAAWSTGYKPGGFDGSRDTSAFNQGRVYGYETSENFEVGVSAELLQGALLANATIFRTDISGHQSRVNFGTMDAIGNRASIQQQGIEADLNWRPMEQLTVSVAGAWLDSTYSDFQGAPDWPGLNTPAGTNLTGKRAFNSPNIQVDGFVRWDDVLPWVPGWTWSALARTHHVGARMLSGDGSNYPLFNEPAYMTADARVGVRSADGLEISVAGRNLLDETTCTSRYVQPRAVDLGVVDTVNGGAIIRCDVSAPRTFVVEVSQRF
jgi:iron complex outermembrane receptor protein